MNNKSMNMKNIFEFIKKNIIENYQIYINY